ncbi:MAG: hypothetical protein JO182_26105 [Acidobacteriaceae bacterium]|nr:hypothetical protein [Acidobacteriaceae bacterium]MBV9037988.1 hypothetical protein [Acidobacteriaceae bacterium]
MSKFSKQFSATTSSALLCAIVLAVALSTPARGDDDRVTVFPLGSQPGVDRLTYEDLSARWWQWVLTIPVPSNPTTDTTGANCYFGQTGRVFFLAGNNSNLPAVTRNCVVPSGKILFFPIINVECSNVEPPPFFGKNERQLRACADEFMDGTQLSSLKLTINNKALVKNLSAFRVQSPLFTYTVPANNLQGVPEGTAATSVSDGFWIMAELSPGDYTIHFEGQIVSGPGAGSSQNVTYKLKVVGEDSDQ